MYKLEEHTTDLQVVAVMPPPFGPGFASDEIVGAVRLELWATDFEHESEFVDFYLLDANGEVMRMKRVLGY
jgi:hypothetical protein